jgi:hypothetical protein
VGGLRDRDALCRGSAADQGVCIVCIVVSMAELASLIPQYATEFDDLVADVVGGEEPSRLGRRT